MHGDVFLAKASSNQGAAMAPPYSWPHVLRLGSNYWQGCKGPRKPPLKPWRVSCSRSDIEPLSHQTAPRAASLLSNPPRRPAKNKGSQKPKTYESWELKTQHWMRLALNVLRV